MRNCYTRQDLMMRLPDPKMSELLKFALCVNESRGAEGQSLAGVPDELHRLLNADRSIFCLRSGSASQLQSLVRRIEHASPPQIRKWSNDSCVARSFGLDVVRRNEIGRAIVCVGRNHSSNRIICAMLSRDVQSDAFSLVDFSMSHLAVGFALDSVGLRSGMGNVAIELTGREKRRLHGGGASLSARIDHFLSNTD
jgi:hypothetical protein